MQIAKLRISEESGFVPAGAYFQRLSANLQKANAAEAAFREELDAEDRALEARYCRASASRSNTYEQGAAYA